MDRVDLRVPDVLNVFLGHACIGPRCAFCVYVYTHLKWISRFLVRLEEVASTIHRNDLWMQFYDYDLDPNVGTPHAISIEKTARILSESVVSTKARRETQVASNGRAGLVLRETTPYRRSYERTRATV